MTETLRGLPHRILIAGAAMGAGVAALWLLSPFGSIFALAIAILFFLALRGLGPRERRWVAGLLGAALALRLLALLAFAVMVDYNRDQFPILIGDERYTKNVSLWLHNIYFGIPISPTNFGNAFAWRNNSEGFFYLLAYAQILLGPSPYGGHFLNMGCFFAATVLMYRTVRARFGPLPALGSLAVVLFLPTVFVWSISALKDPSHALALAMIVVAALHAVRARTPARQLAFAGLTAASVGIAGAMRPGALAIGVATVGVATVIAAYAGTIVTSKRRLAIIAVGLACVLVVLGSQSSTIRARSLSLARGAGQAHLAHVLVPGYTYKLLDERFYVGNYSILDTMTLADTARFVTRAAISFVAVPTPGQVMSWSGLAQVPQQIVWYVLVPLALVGCAAGFRRDVLLTFLLLITIVCYAAAVALLNGNIGTMVRHRDLIVPMVVWFSGLGATSTLGWLAARVGGRLEGTWGRFDTLAGGTGW